MTSDQSLDLSSDLSLCQISDVTINISGILIIYLVPQIHFGCLGPDNDPHYPNPDIKNLSLGLVPEINNGD